MAMIRCPECGGMVSDEVDICIHCGKPKLKEYLLQKRLREALRQTVQGSSRVAFHNLVQCPVYEILGPRKGVFEGIFDKKMMAGAPYRTRLMNVFMRDGTEREAFYRSGRKSDEFQICYIETNQPIEILIPFGASGTRYQTLRVSPGEAYIVHWVYSDNKWENIHVGFRFERVV